MKQDLNARYENADKLRLARRYEEAGSELESIWNEAPSKFVGWRLAYCLRKAGRLEEAESIAQQALDAYPDDAFTRSELGWILREKHLRSAKDDRDLGRALEVARRIVAVSDNKMLLVRVVLDVMKVAKDKGSWEVVLEWSERVSSEDLRAEPVVLPNGTRAMSQRQVWYIGRSRALLELGRYDEACSVARAGLGEFPNCIHLNRTAALALEGAGELSSAIGEMQALLAHPRADWYVKADLARMLFRAGNAADAYRLICEAVLSTRQSDEYKLTSYITLAQIALARNDLDVAAMHVALVKAIAAEQGWQVKREVIQTENQVLAALKAAGRQWPEVPKDRVELSRMCERKWREGQYEGLELHRGTVKPYPQDRAFTFIQRDDGAEDVFVLVQDLPENCRKPGSRVEFALVSSFDRKKGRESVRAVNIRCAPEARR